MTEQDIFDKVVSHLLTQNKQSTYISDDGFNRCAYRGEGGLMCAAGCLIPNSVYKKSFEGNIWGALDCQGLIPKKLSQFIDIISQLQMIHDVEDVCDWEEHLKKLGEDFSLKWNYKGKL